jgi:hypothetical protein
LLIAQLAGALEIELRQFGNDAVQLRLNFAREFALLAFLLDGVADVRRRLADLLQGCTLLREILSRCGL